MLFFKKKRTQEEQDFISFLRRLYQRVSDVQKITTKSNRTKNERGNWTIVFSFLFEDKVLFFYKEFYGSAPVYFAVNDLDTVTHFKHDKKINELISSIFYTMITRILDFDEKKTAEDRKKIMAECK